MTNSRPAIRPGRIHTTPRARGIPYQNMWLLINDPEAEAC